MGKPYTSQAPVPGYAVGLKPAPDSSAALLKLAPTGLRQSSFRAKRLLDIVLASFLIFLTFPLLLGISLLVAMDGGPVLFKHHRIGRYGAGFGCLKFRTMILGAEECLDEYLSYHPEARAEWERDRKLTFDPRVTKIGRFLRISSLDELPQLLNVLRGEMSIVGPRPVTQEELAQYGGVAKLYRSVRPGITGLWQISGRNDTTYAARVSLDERYVRNWSLALDLGILLRTPVVVLARRGAR